MKHIHLYHPFNWAQFIFFLALFSLVAFCSNAQTGGELVEIIRKWPKKVDVNVTDGLVHKRTVSDESDTAFYFHAQGKKFIATTTFKEVGVVVPPVFVTEKVDGERATFTGTWTRGVTTAPGWYGVPSPTIAYSNSAGASVSYTFTGTKVELWGERRTTHGTGTVSIDNGAAQPVSFIGPSALPVLIYSSPDLQLGSHTIRLNVVSGYNLLDYFSIVKPQ